MVPLNSLMILLPVKFIRVNFDYFLGRLNSLFYEEASALQLFGGLLFNCPSWSFYMLY